MTQYHRVLLAVGITWCAALSATFSQPMTAPGGALRKPTIPPGLKTADSLTTSEVKTINTTVAENFKALLDPNPAVQQSAREAIVLDSRGAGELKAPFINCYAEAMIREIMSPAIANAKSMRVRLNAAIALAKVGESIKSAKLESAVLMYLGENQPYALRLWGVSAAKGILPEVVKVNAGQKLMGAIVAAVTKHPTGAMAAEAYDTLQVRDANVISVLLDVLAFRIGLYKKGLPEDPNTEVGVFTFLVQDGVWNGTLSAAHRLKVMQAFCDVLVLAAYQGDAQPPGPGPREQLQDVVMGAVRALVVAAKHQRDPDLESVATVAERAARISGANLGAAVKDLPAAIRKAKGFESVVEPKLSPPPSTNPIVVN